ncbi:MAG: hypothetical protein AB2L07_17655 [Thermoanaerobaculaceae bacterium]
MAGRSRGGCPAFRLWTGGHLENAGAFPDTQATPLVHKLEWRTVSDAPGNGRLLSVLETLGLRLEATLANDFGPGRDEVVYAKTLALVPGSGT